MLHISTKLIERFNRQNGLIIVSSYPEKGHTYSGHVGGIASFTKNTATSIQNKPVIVLAEALTHEEVYEEQGVLVIRAWRRNDPKLWLTLLGIIKTFSNVPRVLVEYDFALYGNIATSGLVIVFLAILRTLRKEVSILLHSVVTDTKPLAGHLGLDEYDLDIAKIHAFNAVFATFYRVIGIASHRAIVTEEVLAETLSRFMPREQISVIPHGIDTTLKSVPKETAKRLLGIDPTETVVMQFGFINQYKGTDFFVKAFQDCRSLLGLRTHFILAGGQSATLNDKAYYQRFYGRISRDVDNAKSIKITGFVRQEDIPLYYSAADLIVFPYKAFICASGPLSMVFSYQKPFIVSKPLVSAFGASDLKQALTDCDLTEKDISFGLTPTSLRDRAEKVLRNGLKQKMITMAGIIRTKRSWKEIGMLYEDILWQPKVAFALRMLRTFLPVPAYAKR